MHIEKIRSIYFLHLFLLISTSLLPSVSAQTIINSLPGHTQAQKQVAWADSVLAQLNLRQKIGQLFVVPAYSDSTPHYEQQLKQQVAVYQPGGVLFLQGGPLQQAELTNTLQLLSQVPLLVAANAESGLGTHLDSAINFPKQQTLGAIRSNLLVYNMGAEVARQCKRLGIHINFAPIVDIDTDAATPLIDERSFGENRQNVASKGLAYMQGLQNNGVMATAKHFPGYGHAKAEAKVALPLVASTTNELYETNLFPFQRLIGNGLQGMMMGNLTVPAFEEGTPATLSANAVSFLRDTLNFKGLLITDALHTEGLTKKGKAGEAALLAFKAGNTLLLHPKDLPLAINVFEKAIAGKKLSESQLDVQVKKILLAKARLELMHLTQVQLSNLYEELNTPSAVALKEELYENALTAVRADTTEVPIKQLGYRFASVSIGEASNGTDTLRTYLSRYAPFTHYVLEDAKKPWSAYKELLDKLVTAERVVVGLYGLNHRKADNFGINTQMLQFLRELDKKTNIILVAFGTPYSIGNFPFAQNLFCAYEDDPLMQKVVAQGLFGAFAVDGRLPVTAADNLPEGTGIRLPYLHRLGYATPERVGMSSAELNRIDSLAAEIIGQQAAPGMQVLVAKDGRIVFNRNYGYYTYNEQDAVTDTTLYDIASVTKVMSALPAIMYLVQNKRLDITKSLSYYLPEADTSNKAQMPLVDIMSHMAGLRSFVPYWVNILRPDKTMDSAYIRNSYSPEFNIRVYDNLWARNNIRDSIWSWTLGSPLTKRPMYLGKHRYWYSDIGFYLMQRVAEKQLGVTLPDFNRSYFYKPLGLQYLTYLPLKKFPKDQIAPTEFDTDLRMDIVQGYVHDPGAALYGGTTAHAGLFSNAHSLAIMMQMYLNRGIYGGQRYLTEDVIKLFNTRPYEDYRNRRGLGWDKPLIAENALTDGPTSPLASQQTFGHQGFTGTAVWADPKYNMVFIFLSNRVYPSSYNKKLLRENFRPKIMSVIYESMGVKADNL